jgi:catechol 2,3-dioxygenase-like lactoylglutathione lyase family enzyme
VGGACCRSGRSPFVVACDDDGKVSSEVHTMITGVHALIYTSDAEADRAFFRDVLELRSVDAGGGWLIFALPPAELAAHPAEDSHHELYLMCDDVHATVEELKTKGVEFSRSVSDEGFGLVTAIRLPGGGELGLYEPRHPTPLSSRQSES